MPIETLKLRVRMPWWARPFMRVLIIAAFCGVAVSTTWAAGVIVGATKMDLVV
jgi:hypothetical protein